MDQELIKKRGRVYDYNVFFSAERGDNILL